MIYFNRTLLMFLVLLVLTSCVTKKKYLYLERKYYNAYDENKILGKEVGEISAQNKDYLTLIESLKKEVEELKTDTAESGKSLRGLEGRYEQLYHTYVLLEKTSKKAIEGTTAEIFTVQNELIETQKALQERENKLNQTAIELKDKETKLAELQDVLDKQKKVVGELKQKVSAALLGFENHGLTVDIKNGKVYVSLEEKLLFATGSTKVDANGEEALKKLAIMLQNNKDINVLIEGHTDNVPYTSSAGCIKDNWDLSVLRATSIVRILIKHGEIDPVRLIPAGRGEFLPIDPADTNEARAKNRRIEIILTPKLDELFQIIGSH